MIGARDTLPSLAVVSRLTSGFAGSDTAKSAPGMRNSGHALLAVVAAGAQAATPSSIAAARPANPVILMVPPMCSSQGAAAPTVNARSRPQIAGG